jgi:hypothetical protein
MLPADSSKSAAHARQGQGACVAQHGPVKLAILVVPHIVKITALNHVIDVHVRFETVIELKPNMCCKDDEVLKSISVRNICRKASKCLSRPRISLFAFVAPGVRWGGGSTSWWDAKSDQFIASVCRLRRYFDARDIVRQAASRGSNETKMTATSIVPTVRHVLGRTGEHKLKFGTWTVAGCDLAIWLVSRRLDK